MAVLAVVLYHAGFPVGNGFLGVDIFFCISGFLICTLIIKQENFDSRSFQLFILRRFERLVPAYLFLILIVSVFGVLIFLPEIINPAIKTGIWSMLISANLFLSNISQDYFGPESSLNILLHTWTLSAEWQFYLILALMLFITGRYLNRLKKFIILFGVSVISLTLFVTANIYQPLQISRLDLLNPYYSPITRFWEFGFGAVGAFLITKVKTKRDYRKIRIIIWFCLIITISFPKFYPVITPIIVFSGTLILLLLQNPITSKGNFIFGKKIFEKIGDASYSIYLWHWPFISTTKFLFPGNFYAEKIALLISFLPAALSWYFIEKKFRKWLVLQKFQFEIVKLLYISTLVVILCSLFIVNNLQVNQNIFERKIKNNGDIVAANFQSMVNEKFPKCKNNNVLANAPRYKNIIQCHQSTTISEPSIAILGDSHAQQTFVALAKVSNKNVIYLTTENGLILAGDSKSDVILKYVIETKSIQTVIFSSRWDIRGVPIEKMNNTVSAIVKVKKNVFLFDDLPTFHSDLSTCKYVSPFLGINLCSMDSKIYFPSRKLYMDKLIYIKNRNQNLKLVTFPFFVCDKKLCHIAKNGEMIFRDSNHLTDYGALSFGNYLLNNNLFLRKILVEYAS